MRTDDYKKALIDAGLTSGQVLKRLGLRNRTGWSVIVNGHQHCPEKHVKPLCKILDKTEQHLFWRDMRKLKV